jgi:hypothetical protein
MREPELLKKIIATWNGIATATTLLPGGMHEHTAEADNVPAGATKWATVRATEESIARMTNGGPIRSHLVVVDVYADDGVTANATLLHTLGTIPSLALASKSLDNGGYLIDLFPATAPAGGQTDQTRRMRNVTKLSIAWRVQSRWDY